MRIFLAGASGALGKRLVPLLTANGHTVVGTTRSPEKAAMVRELGAEPVVVNALNAAAIGEEVARAAPDVVVHQLTALSNFTDLRKFDETFSATNRLRVEGTDNLVAATRAAGVERFVAQSYAGWTYAPTPGPVKTEDDAFHPDPPAEFRQTVAALRHLERAVLAIDGIVLRYGAFYGPDTSLDRDGVQTEAVRKRQFPLVGDATGVWSFIHVDDAAAATLAAIERGRPGIYNVVDDEPAPVAEWLPVLAEAAGAKPPRRMPTWLARLFVGDHGVAMMTQARGASNAKAKRELGWRPEYGSWREGFRAVLQPEAAQARAA